MLYKIDPFDIWDMMRLDYLINSYLKAELDTFNPQFVSVSYTAWLFYHKFYISSFKSLEKLILLYSPSTIPISNYFPFIVSLSLFSLPECFLILILLWIFFATSFCTLDNEWGSKSFLSESIEAIYSFVDVNRVNSLLSRRCKVFLTEGKRPSEFLLICNRRE